MFDDRARRAGRRPDRPSLLALHRVAQRLLIGAFAEAQALQPDRQARVVHHREHVAHAVVLATDEPADSAFVSHDTGRGAVDAELVFDRDTRRRVAFAGRPVGVQEELGHHEHRDALRAGRRTGRSGQHEVDDVVRDVVLTPRDEDLLAGDRPRPVTERLGLGRHGADVRPGLRLGQVHRARPLAGHHLREIGRPLLVGPVGMDRIDRTLGEQRAQRERHVRRREHLLHGDRRDPREAGTAVVGIERHRTEPGLDPLLVGRPEALGQCDRAVRVPRGPDRVTITIGRRNDLGHESTDLREHLVDRRGVRVAEQFGARDLVEVGDVIHREADVAQRWGVLAHTESVPHDGHRVKLGLILSGSPLLCSARNTDRRGRRTVP